MRISAGTYKGRKIGTKKLFSNKSGPADLRPTPSKVREAIFDILKHVLAGASFLDLYAGTGAVGIEAASRGAGRVIFVESVRSRAETIGKMTQQLGISASSEIHSGQALVFLKHAAAAGSRYDIIFADPPYASDEIAHIVPLIAECGILDAQGILLIEHARKKQIPERSGSLVIKKRYHYGDTMLSLYRRDE